MAAMLYTMDRMPRVRKLGIYRLLLQGSVGIPEDHLVSIKELDSSQRQSGFMRWFNESLLTGERVVLTEENGTLPSNLLDDIFSISKERCKAVVISPLRGMANSPIFGWLVLAANPRTAVNPKYLEFVQGITGLISTSMASLMSLQDEISRGKMSRTEAGIQNADLSQRLHESELHAKQQERIFLHFVEHSSMGIFIFSPDGQILYRNRRFNEIYQCDDDLDFSIETAISVYTDPEYTDLFKRKLAAILQKKAPVTFELRLTRPWSPPDSTYKPRDKDDKAWRVWVLASAVPELDSSGEIVQVFGCVTDISDLKWSHHVQERRVAEAIDSKTRLENFIDSTNHELRNPLSAVILAGDDVINTVSAILDKYPSPADVPVDIRPLLSNLVDNGRIILQCAKHQKRIVDDILIASKIGSNLVEVCPVEADPESEIRSCIKMFDADAQEADVLVTFDCSPAYRSLHANNFIFDPTRFLQVFINLLTNAIKFTRFERTRRISVLLDVSTYDPRLHPHLASSSDPTLQYIHPQESIDSPAKGTSQKDPPLSESCGEWGNGKPVFLVVTVRDTGKGLSASESAILFSRFTQASPRTHVKYGGSGLGLFISRRLSELQGGAIGFTSNPAVGSVFSFYIQSRVASSPRRPSAVKHEEETRAGALNSGFFTLQHASPNSSSAISPISPFANNGTHRPETLTVLIVEDNLINQKTLARQLQKLGCTVLVANHGLEAIDRISDSKFGGNPHRDLSIVLLDWEMPVMDGLSCIRRIRELEKVGKLKGRVPVIGVTANARTAQLDQAKDAGMVSSTKLLCCSKETNVVL
jgi:signal transduction histidine kinase/CheY-like chemotaxis protein